MNTPTPEAVTDLADKLRKLATGRTEWRVQNPVTQSFCMSFSYAECVNPQMEATEWRANFASKFPDHPHATYEVAEVRVFSDLEETALKAAAIISDRAAQVPRTASALTDAEALKIFMTMAREIDDWVEQCAAEPSEEEQAGNAIYIIIRELTAHAILSGMAGNAEPVPQDIEQTTRPVMTPIMTSIAYRKANKLRADGFADYATAAVLRKGEKYCIVGIMGDVRWHDAVPGTVEAPTQTMVQAAVTEACNDMNTRISHATMKRALSAALAANKGTS